MMFLPDSGSGILSKDSCKKNSIFSQVSYITTIIERAYPGTPYWKKVHETLT